MRSGVKGKHLKSPVMLFALSSCTPVLTVAQLPRDVVLLACAVFQEAQGGRGVPGVVWVSVQRVDSKDQV